MFPRICVLVSHGYYDKVPETRLLKSQKWMASQSGGQKSKIKVLEELILFEDYGEKIKVSILLPLLLRASGFLWFMDSIVPGSSHDLPSVNVCLCVQIVFLIKIPVM